MVGAIISAVITVIGPDKLSPILLQMGLRQLRWGYSGHRFRQVGSIALTLAVLPFQPFTYKALRLRQLHNVFHNVSVQLSKRKSTVFPLIILTVILKGTPSLV